MATSLALRARAELERRRRGLTDGDKKQALLSFREFIAKVNPKYQFYRHLEKLIAVLQRVADGELSRVMVFMPPRHGKSETISRLFTAYYLYRHPDRWVGVNSYADALATTLSRNARENYVSGGGDLNPAASGVHHWETTDGGGLWAAGVGGPITGKGFHLGVIDDPLKNAEESNSETIREKQKDWYRSTFSTREEPGSAIVIVQTRWHEDDLSGWLLSEEIVDDDDEDMAERWHIVSMPAIKEESHATWPETCTVEPDDREVGEALCPERYSLKKLFKIARRIGSYFWNALFQQTPRPRDGNFLKRSWFDIVDAAPAQAHRVRWWDFAATADGGDYTVGLLMARTYDGVYYIEDVVRGQWSSNERNRIILQTAELDRNAYGGTVQNWREQEPGSSGKDSAEDFVKLLAAYGARYETSTGNKVVRADPFAAQAEAGNVRMVSGDWNKAYLDELTAFPNGKHDDQVDASSGAFNKLALIKSVPTDFSFGNLTSNSKWRQ